MTVKEIIIEKLKSMGADGLCCEDCGCGLDDLEPCSCINIDMCVPAIWSMEEEDFIPMEVAK